jgi:hypothetical protein
MAGTRPTPQRPGGRKARDGREIFSTSNGALEAISRDTCSSSRSRRHRTCFIDGVPFTADQFYEVFAIYNRQFGIAVAGWWITCLVYVAMAARNPAAWSRLLTFVLAALWAWNAIAYHAVLFTRINPAAWLFGALFAIESGLLIWAGARRPLEYFSSTRPLLGIGATLVVYSLLYPFLSALSHAYPATPTFGVPCPTAMLTIGLLLTLRDRVPALLAVIPVVWALIGGSAATLLAVPTDYVLLVAGTVLMVMLIAQVRSGALVLRTQAPEHP